jgi:hypothetical protein
MFRNRIHSWIEDFEGVQIRSQDAELKAKAEVNLNSTI